jgi:hypothetical protein
LFFFLSIDFEFRKNFVLKNEQNAYLSEGMQDKAVETCKQCIVLAQESGRTETKDFADLLDMLAIAVERRYLGSGAPKDAGIVDEPRRHA